LNTVLLTILSAVGAMFASTGFWSYITWKREKRDADKKLLLGLAHDRLINLTSKYIHRGFITHEEYDDLENYLYKPYKERGGNGTVDKFMQQVDKLEVRAVSNMSDMQAFKEDFYGLKDTRGGDRHG